MTHLNLQPTALIDPSPNAFGLFSIVSPTNGCISKKVALLEGLTAGFPLTKVPSVVGSTEIFLGSTREASEVWEHRRSSRLIRWRGVSEERLLQLEALNS